MHNGNQEEPPEAVGATGPPDDPFPLAPDAERLPPPPPGPRAPGDPDLPSDPTGQARHPGLTLWLTIVTVLGLVAAILGQYDASALVGLAGMFISAQGADLDLLWRRIYHMISWVVPFSGMLVFAAITTLLHRGTLPEPTRMILVLLSGASAVLCMLTGLRPVSNALIRVLFRGEAPSHTLRLSARLVLFVLLAGIPGPFVLRTRLNDVLEHLPDFVNLPSLLGELTGYVVLALAGVGFLVRRSLPATLERLGIGPLRARHAGVVVAGVLVLAGFNAGMEWVQRVHFPALWASDQAFGNAIAASMGPAEIVLLGLSAGIGEEITMRGALQPRLGIVLTSALFALLHVQYSWFGMLVIFALGVLLGTIRRMTNTSVAMMVHALYDMLAVVTVFSKH